MSNQFKTTYRYLKTATHYTKPLSYDEWLNIADDLKVGVLFVQFYEQISLAWYKLRTAAAVEEECVSEVLAYLTKNVYGTGIQKLHSTNLKNARSLYKDEIKSIHLQRAEQFHAYDIKKLEVMKGRPLTINQKIELLSPQERLTDDEIIGMLKDNEKLELKFDPETTKITKQRFRPAYIYQVASNCLYCKSIDPYSGQAKKTSWYNNVTSNIIVLDYGSEDEIDIFDTTSCPTNLEDDYEYTTCNDKFWKLIEDTNKDTKSVINHILNGDILDSEIEDKYDIILKDLRSMIESRLTPDEIITLLS
jgi:hypothetical protein